MVSTINKAARPMQWIASELRNPLPPPSLLDVVPALLLLARTFCGMMELKKALKAHNGFTFQ